MCSSVPLERLPDEWRGRETGRRLPRWRRAALELMMAGHAEWRPHHYGQAIDVLIADRHRMSIHACPDGPVACPRSE
jgi:hypothetical protein